MPQIWTRISIMSLFSNQLIQAIYHKMNLTFFIGTSRFTFWKGNNCWGCNSNAYWYRKSHCIIWQPHSSSGSILFAKFRYVIFLDIYFSYCPTFFSMAVISGTSGMLPPHFLFNASHRKKNRYLHVETPCIHNDCFTIST